MLRQSSRQPSREGARTRTRPSPTSGSSQLLNGTMMVCALCGPRISPIEKALDLALRQWHAIDSATGAHLPLWHARLTMEKWTWTYHCCQRHAWSSCATCAMHERARASHISSARPCIQVLCGYKGKQVLAYVGFPTLTFLEPATARM